MDIAFLANSVQDLQLLSQKFLQLTGKLVPHEKAMVLLYSEPQHRFVPCADIRCERALLTDYIEQYHRMDYLGWHIYQAEAGVIRESDKISSAEREKTAFFQKFMRNYEIEHRVLFSMQSTESELLGVAMFFRSHIFEDFTARELAIFGLFRQHFAAAVEHSMRFEETRRRGAVVQEVYQNIADTVLIFDNQFKLKDANQRARLYLAELQTQMTRYDVFLASLEAVLEPLRARLDHSGAQQIEFEDVTLSEGAARIGLIATGSIVEQESYEVVVVLSPVQTKPVRGEPQALQGGQAIPKAEDKALLESFLEALRKQYSLTRREINVMEFAIEGLENREIAARLHISLFTVKSHFQNSYAKLGVRSKQELFLLYMKYSVSEDFRQEFESQTRKDEFW